jgi:hypothetical protein
MFSPSVLLDVAREQRKDYLKEAQTVRLLQLAAAPQPEIESQPHSKFNQALELLGSPWKKQPGRI